MWIKRNITDVRLIVGIGNPEPKYAHTYHNVGILCLTYLRKREDFPSIYALAISTCNMNLSGVCIKKLLKEYDVVPEQLLILHDDSDITLGSYKLSFNRGAAGHKGVTSIIKHLGTKMFWRGRIGVRAPEERGRAERFVLRTIREKDNSPLEEVFQSIEDAFITT